MLFYCKLFNIIKKLYRVILCQDYKQSTLYTNYYLLNGHTGNDCDGLNIYMLRKEKHHFGRHGGAMLMWTES